MAKKRIKKGAIVRTRGRKPPKGPNPMLEFYEKQVGRSLRKLGPKEGLKQKKAEHKKR